MPRNTELENRIQDLEGQLRERERIYREEIAHLTAENELLVREVEQIKAGRLKPTPSELIQSFQVAMEELRKSLAGKPGEVAGYTVSRFDVDLRGLVTADKETKGVRILLPEPQEKLDPALLSTIRFSLGLVPLTGKESVPFVTVPTLLGLPLKVAGVALEQGGLVVGGKTFAESRYPADHVIGQSPDPGDEVPEGTAIDLTIAMPPGVEVPDLRGLSEKEARERIARAGLKPGMISSQETGDEKKWGIILGQDPPAGSRVPRDSPVAILMGAPPSVRIPGLIDLPLEEAKNLLTESLLVPGRVTYHPDRQKNGVVTGQKPPAGTEVPVQTRVDLEVARLDISQKILRSITKHELFKSVGISAPKFMERMREMNLFSREQFQEFFGKEDPEILSALGLPTLRSAHLLKRIVKEVLGGET